MPGCNVANQKRKLAKSNQPTRSAADDSSGPPLSGVSKAPTVGPAVASVEFSDRFSEKPWLTAAIMIAAVWWLALSLLGLLSANPTTVNRRQIVDSDLVVAAILTDRERGLVEVTRQWIDPNPQTSLTVSGLDEFDLNNGDSVVLPLTGGPDGTFYLTRVQRTNSQPEGTTYIYPTTDVVFQQVEDIAAIK
jgi:hypothetical protein